VWVAGEYPTKIWLDSRHIFYRRRVTWIYNVNFLGKHFCDVWMLWFLLNRQSGVESQHLLHVCIVPLSLDFVANRGENNFLIIYRAPCKQGDPRNFYIKTLRGLNAIWTSGALFPGVVWFEHEASQSHHSSTELTFKSLTRIHGVHRDDSSHSELAWNDWVRSE